ncbi:putative small multidrug efflux protein [Niallia circulans]|jgi:uncharacterized membrane protein|uniref:small multi-drug export protein n=1 Tax=Shouchella clausii TaxID=79880 RepID=UPI000BA682E1|nr:small multi-drug export protein [Shouchella clausii]MCM3547606.1 small multi-drug export protein [Shouchella clausii]PAF16384.1 hypothetical protein CHH59_00325 [Shouchella clausii]SPT80654.1 putative small multidrug efflux protein [Niallia circulans]
MEADSLWLSLLFVASMIPFIEYTLAVPVGILFVNQPPVLTVLVSILGNSIGVVLLVLLSEKIRDWTLKRQNSQKSGRQSSKQQEKTKHFLEKYGMPGVGILAPILLSSHIGAVTAVALGVSRSYAILWTLIGVVLWAIIFGIICVYASHWLLPFFGQ